MERNEINGTDECRRDDMENVKAELSGKDTNFREGSLNGSLWKVILSVGLPLAFYQSLNQLFKILDTMMASHISSRSVSAVAYLSQISIFLSSIGAGLAVGSGIKISRAYGEGDYRMVKRRVSSLYAICVVTGLVILAVIFPFVEEFLALAGTPAALIEEGCAYFRVELVCLVVQVFNGVYISVERARGNSGRIMYLNLMVIGVKLGLTAFFVYGLEGDLVMISWASLISQVCLMIFGVARGLMESDNAFGFSLKAVTLKREVVGPMLSQSFPVMVEKMAFAFGKTVVNAMSVSYGELTVGALGVSNNLGGINTNPQNGIQEGGASIISQNMGAGKPERAVAAFWRVLILNLIIGGVFMTLTLLGLDQLAGLFDGGDPQFHQLIMDVYQYEALGALTLGVNSAVMSLLYGLGKTKLTLAINFSRVFIFRIPVLWALQRFTTLGAESVGIVMLVSNVSVGVVAAAVAAVVLRGMRRNRF
ncbi:MAG: MATE family efflux transporter [Clostridium sp.]|nr:MATE family efflux transporter [Acetatifactor muris]MCM1562729.1 MATE family efflux transporter [Clostridium sp.]